MMMSQEQGVCKPENKRDCLALSAVRQAKRWPIAANLQGKQRFAYGASIAFVRQATPHFGDN
jgi:hypothetical protein